MTPGFIVLCVAVLAAAGLLFLTGHGPHVVGYLPFLILFACPLMHLLLHGKHHRHGAGRH